MWIGVLLIYTDMPPTQEPVRVKLGEQRVWKGTGSKRRCVLEEDTFMYIPVLNTLETLLQNDSILAEVHVLVCAFYTIFSRVSVHPCVGTHPPFLIIQRFGWILYASAHPLPCSWQPRVLIASL